MQTLATFVAGLVFGLGLVASGLINPMKVQNFLDLAGRFDPSLAVTMAVAVAVTTVGYGLVLKRAAPLFGDRFQIPATSDIDARLITGSALFGIGWGLAGFCPGPAISAASLGALPAIVFTAAMLAGMAAARWLATAPPAAVHQIGAKP